MENEYREPYLIIFAATEDALKAMENNNFGVAKDILMKGQLDAEEAFISFGENEN